MEIYPNLYVVLVSPPGVGKSMAIERTKEIWRGTKKLFIAPNSVSKASLLDEIADSPRKIVTGTSMVEYSFLSIGASEFGVLVPAYDLDFLNVLNDIFDNPPIFKDRKRTTKSVEIINPSINFVAGTQPGYLASILPETAWSMGFMSRVMMVYCGSGPELELSLDVQDIEDDGTAMLDAGLRQGLMIDAMRLTGLMGGARWTVESSEEIKRWNKTRMEPTPEHSKLQHYNARRFLTFMKLCLIATVSRTCGTGNAPLAITLEDVTRAKDWMLQAETMMPDVFREMVGKSDSVVIQELHFFMWRIYVRTKKPMHTALIWNFLQERASADKIQRIITTAEKSNIISRVAGTEDMYVPRARHEHGVVE